MTAKLKWMLIIGVFAIIGGFALILGFWLAGFDILGWFTTKWAFIVYFFAGLYALALGCVMVYDYVMRR